MFEAEKNILQAHNPRKKISVNSGVETEKKKKKNSCTYQSKMVGP